MTDPALLERITRSLAFMLRHQPELFDLELDPLGYASLDETVRALNEKLGERVVVEDVLDAVQAGDRQRYEIVGDRIRALYGHSIPVEPGPAAKPPETLYVAIPSRDADRARRFGLRGGRRRFLHLATTVEDAREAGRRLDWEYTVLSIRALDAWEEGVDFYDRISLWLAQEVPTHFLDAEGAYDDGAPAVHGGGRDRGRSPRNGRERREGRGRPRSSDRPRGSERHDDPEDRGFERDEPRSSDASVYGASTGEERDRPRRRGRRGRRGGSREGREGGERPRSEGAFARPERSPAEGGGTAYELEPTRLDDVAPYETREGDTREGDAREGRAERGGDDPDVGSDELDSAPPARAARSRDDLEPRGSGSDRGRERGRGRGRGRGPDPRRERDGERRGGPGSSERDRFERSRDDRGGRFGRSQGEERGRGRPGDPGGSGPRPERRPETPRERPAPAAARIARTDERPAAPFGAGITDPGSARTRPVEAAPARPERAPAPPPRPEPPPQRDPPGESRESPESSGGFGAGL